MLDPYTDNMLFSHQAEALAMMVEKETGVYAHAKFPTLWEPVRSLDGHLQYGLLAPCLLWRTTWLADLKLFADIDTW